MQLDQGQQPCAPHHGLYQSAGLARLAQQYITIPGAMCSLQALDLKLLFWVTWLSWLKHMNHLTWLTWVIWLTWPKRLPW